MLSIACVSSSFRRRVDACFLRNLHGMYSIWEVKSQSLGLTQVLYPVADSPPRRSPTNLIFAAKSCASTQAWYLSTLGVGLTKAIFPKGCFLLCCFGKGFFDREDASDRAECWRCLRILRFVPSLQPNTVAVFPKSSMSLLSFILTYIMANWIKYNSRITADSRCTASHDWLLGTNNTSAYTQVPNHQNDYKAIYSWVQPRHLHLILLAEPKYAGCNRLAEILGMSHDSVNRFSYEKDNPRTCLMRSSCILIW